MQLKSREEKESSACCNCNNNHDSSHKNSYSTTLLNRGIKQTSKCHFKTEDHSIKCPPRRGGDGASVAFLSNVAIASLLEEKEDFCDTIYSRQYHSIRTCL